MLFFSCLSITSAFITHAGAMASRSAVLSLAEAGISPQVGAPRGRAGPLVRALRAGWPARDRRADRSLPGGALEVPGGTEVIPIVNALVRRFEHVVLSQDWHPPETQLVRVAARGQEPAYDETQMPYGAQTLWPDHCVQNTPGSAFHADLAIPARAHICRKGFRSAIDSYSAFFENDRVTGTGLQAHFQELGVTTVYVVGVAYDFCVRFSCEDAAARCGATAVLVKDATRAVGLRVGGSRGEGGWNRRGCGS